MANRKFKYKINGVSKIDVLTSTIKSHAEVEDCYVENDTLYYILTDQADEYQIMMQAYELCADLGGELIVDDYAGLEDMEQEQTEQEPTKENPAYSTVNEENNEEEAQEETGEDGDNENQIKVTASADDDFDYQDRLVIKKQTVKKDAIIRIGELILSTILLVVCYLLPDSQTQALSVKMFVGVFAFAIGGYEIFYSAIGDLVHKKFLSENVIMSIACLLGAFLGYLVETTALALVFGVAKEIENFANGVSQNKIEEIFYTGSVAVTTEANEEKKLADISVNDVLCLNQYDIIPCDGVANNNAILDCYRSLGVPEMEVFAGDKVYAGSVVLSDGLKMTAETTNAESLLTQKKNAFLEKLKSFTGLSKTFTFVDLALVLVSLLIAFIPPIFGKQGYLLDLQVWGARGIALLSISTISYAFYLAGNCIKNALITLKYEEIEVNDISTFGKVAGANAFKFKASTLTENGIMKDDTYGVMNELLAAGVKNVETEFDLELSEEERAKLDFVQKDVKDKKEVTVGEDITLEASGNIAIERGEISFVPLCFKVAKQSYKAKTSVIILKALSFIATIVALIFVPAKIINPIYFGVINCAITALFALFSLSILKKKN